MYIYMGDIFTSGDLPEDHDELGPCMLIDPIEAHNNTPETA